jgi:hypothetical protein
VVGDEAPPTGAAADGVAARVGTATASGRLGPAICAPIRAALKRELGEKVIWLMVKL